MFNTELEFEKTLTDRLTHKGWSKEIIVNPTPEQLLDNWAEIVFQNNKEIDRLNGVPLSHSEKQQLLALTQGQTPFTLNKLLIGGSVMITRDNPADTLHCGKEVSLRIFDKNAIAGGNSVYQIVRQPQFPTAGLNHNRRGDVMLLINGIPVIHIELKRSGIPVSQAENQINKYLYENVFSGIFAWVQLFVAMTPEDMKYFANMGEPTDNFDFHVRWADVNNNAMKSWEDISQNFLSIPMAHSMVGYYTIADEETSKLKVLRSYQYWAIHKITDAVHRHDWQSTYQRGGFIWHTTGAGKTLTSFKAAQLIAQGGKADKVIFVTDRIELGTQSLKEYKNFAGDAIEVQDTQNTDILRQKLLSNNFQDSLVVTSIQKLNIISTTNEISKRDLQKINEKKIIFIVDEAHRDVFGEMMCNIKKTFIKALFFGFTGTPIQKQNAVNKSTQEDIFGDELHRYSIADGICDNNVLGFDPYRIETFKEKDIRKQVALRALNYKTELEAITSKLSDDYRERVRLNSVKYPMPKVEKEIPPAQYRTNEHRQAVISDILDNWNVRSNAGRFHAIFATASICEAINYYYLLKDRLVVTCIFDDSDKNDDGDFGKYYEGQLVSQYKSKGLNTILADYNERFGKRYDRSMHDKFKRDVAMRLAHKDVYRNIENHPENQLNIVIVVNQMLTGYDSSWVNTLYLDKMLEYANLIQAFSRTNRTNGPSKPHGVICYYRRPHTMEQNVHEALALYSGGNEYAVYASKLYENLNCINEIYEEIIKVFVNDNIYNFSRIPISEASQKEFVRLFNLLNKKLNAAKIQGFDFHKLIYLCPNKDGQYFSITASMDELHYKILLLRYNEISRGKHGPGGEAEGPFEIEPHLTTLGTGTINAEYINEHFKRFCLSLTQKNVTEEEKTKLVDALIATFVSLPNEQQAVAEIIIRDIQTAQLQLEPNKTFMEYIVDYQSTKERKDIEKTAELLGLDADKLWALFISCPTETNINGYNRFEDLMETLDRHLAKKYWEQRLQLSLKLFNSNIRTRNILRKMLIEHIANIEEMPIN